MLAWTSGLRAMVAERTGGTFSGRWTAGGAAAASFLADYAWCAGTYRSRACQLRKWFLVCDDERHDPVPASERNIFGHIDFLFMIGLVELVSTLQYVTAVSRFHKKAGDTSLTKTRLVPSVRVRTSTRPTGKPLHPSFFALGFQSVSCAASLT